MNMIEQIESEQIEKLTADKTIPQFAAGDTLRVHVKVVEGTRERIQIFEGVCIARKNARVNSSFTVRKISYGEGVERVFSLYSPRIDKIEVERRGQVRRAKLYYLRGRTGKRARIAEKIIHGDGAAEAKEVATAADFEAAEMEAAVRDTTQEKENASEETATVETEEKTEKTPKKAENKTD